MTPDTETSTGEPPHAPRPTSRSAQRTFAALLVSLTLVLPWARGVPSFVAWEVARDHERCFGHLRPPARLWSSDPSEVRDWLEGRGTPLQPPPARAGRVALIGVRYCPLVDRIAAHVYYAGRRSLVSVFVLSGPARIGSGWTGEIFHLQVKLFYSAGRTLAIVGESAEDVEAMTRAFRSSVA